MQAKGFFSSLFDYSFSSFITPRLIKVLYVLMTISVALWTLLVILVAFKASAALGILALVIVAPIFFVITMIYVRVGLELIMAFFHIHGDVEEINRAAAAPAIPEWRLRPQGQARLRLPPAPPSRPRKRRRRTRARRAPSRPRRSAADGGALLRQLRHGTYPRQTLLHQLRRAA